MRDPGLGGIVDTLEIKSANIPEHKVVRTYDDLMSGGGVYIDLGDGWKHFYLGTTQPTPANYETLTPAFSSLSEMDGATIRVPSSGKIYLLVPYSNSPSVVQLEDSFIDNEGNTITPTEVDWASPSIYRHHNWELSFEPGTVLTYNYLTKSPVTIMADNKTMIYGDDVPTLTYKSSGATLNGTPKLSTTATKTSPVGTYPIKVEKGTVTNKQVTYVDGTLTIGKAELTVGVQNVTITEGDAIPTFTLTYSGWRNNDTQSNAFTTKPKATTTATSASKPGTYPITVSGGSAQNYALTYTQGTLTIKEKEKQPIAEGIYELTVEMFHLWDDCTATAKVVQQNGGGKSLVGEPVGEWALVYGVESVYYLRYADLTDYDKLVIIGTPGMKLRVLMNRKEVGNGGGDANGGSWIEIKPVIGGDGMAVVPLTDYDFAHLNAIKTDLGTPNCTVNNLALIKGNPDMTQLGIDQLSDGLVVKPVIYDLFGCKLTSLRKGINIVGGKKVFVP